MSGFSSQNQARIIPKETGTSGEREKLVKRESACLQTIGKACSEVSNFPLKWLLALETKSGCLGSAWTYDSKTDEYC
jgi:hypothetical protein